MREQKMACANNYSLSILIRAAIGSALDSKNKFPQIHEVFPDLFEDTSKQQDWRIAKERMMKFANNHNKKRGQEA